MYLDTRDLEELLVELEAAALVYAEAKENLYSYNGDDEDKIDRLKEELEEVEADFSEDDEKKLIELRELKKEITEWEYGETLIPKDEFPDYVQELCEDCGYISRDFPDWIVIDWQTTSENVSVDYMLVEYNGEKYYVRHC